MCGICGMIGEPDRDLLGRMMETIRHRGPDDQGTHLDAQAALGHTRLSIIDVAGGRQPITSEDGRYCIVFNGEIYNHLKLRCELEAKGHRFKTRSDTEAILHLYEEVGEECPERLRGMFAFAIWDTREHTLFLARDRLGIKPLFYTQAPRRFSFASELKALLADEATRRDIDLEALDRYLTFMYVPAPATILRSVRKLPAGHTLLLKDGKPTIRQYWDLPPTEACAAPAESENEAQERLTELFRDAVSARLMSEVPLGAYLSGGLDSSLVVAMMCGESGAPVNTFSVGFDEARFDERPHAQRVAGALHTAHHELVARHDAFDELPKIIWHLDEPVADSAVIPTYLMAELTKRHVTVVLTGEGADELFAGYSHYKIFRAGHAMRRVVPSFAPRWAAALLRWQTTLHRIALYAAQLRDPAAAYLALKSVFTEKEKQNLYCGTLRREWAGFEPPVEMVGRRLRAGPEEDYLGRLLRLDLKTWLPDDLLVKVDRMTMAHAVEARVPYLDYKVVEMAMRLPSRLKLRAGAGKVIMRRMARGILPPATVRRRKTGFAVPISRWAHGALRDFVEEVLSPESIRRRGFFDPKSVQALLRRQPFCEFHRRQFWTLLVLEMWCREFLDRPPATQHPSHSESRRST